MEGGEWREMLKEEREQQGVVFQVQWGRRYGQREKRLQIQEVCGADQARRYDRGDGHREQRT